MKRCELEKLQVHVHTKTHTHQKYTTPTGIRAIVNKRSTIEVRTVRMYDCPSLAVLSAMERIMNVVCHLIAIDALCVA